jgi:drug/metabolite transporter (DMT)-like permease
LKHEGQQQYQAILLKKATEQGEDMTDIQLRYGKAKKLYLLLLAVLLSIIIINVFAVPSGQHTITPIEWLMYLLLLIICIAMYLVLRCPNCRAFLLPAYSSAWGNLKKCPDCGVALIEIPQRGKKK